MRIIAGKWRGVPIAAPKGQNTRPTVDRVRESLMSSLNSALCGFEGVVALDAFGGSGALGIEVLSRGAEQVWFYEMNHGSYTTLAANLEKLHIDKSQATLRKADVLATPPVQGHKPFHLVLLDPPYALSAQVVFDFLDNLAQRGALANDVVVSYEHARADDVSNEIEQSAVQWKVLAHKTFGETAIDILERECND